MNSLAATQPLSGHWTWGATNDSGYGALSTGEHRGLGAGISKVRSLKMDKKVWTETLIQVGGPCLLPVCGQRPTQLLRPHCMRKREREGERADSRGCRDSTFKVKCFLRLFLDRPGLRWAWYPLTYVHLGPSVDPGCQ